THFSPDRSNIEQYITDRFYMSYQAKISTFLPYLLSTHTDNNLTAALGFQPATENQPLFLEQYMTSAIEEVVSSLTLQNVARNKIVEIGNLTSSRRGTSQILFILIVAILYEAGFEWTVFTATSQVKQLIEKLNLNTTTLCDANPDYLADKGESWGSYYDNKPTVLLGNLADAVTLLKQHSVIGFALHNYQSTIVNIARQIKQ
ncbi:MAG: thermostable hemolysin, partial [Gammaproteobacteria bacterium]|nr:thermostable hemolysin [Gammaproteobacteria bacterium]